MTQIIDEDPMSIRDFCERMDFSESKVRRLIRHGCESISGRIVRLECVLTESGMKTSLSAYKRFLIQLNTPAEDEQ